MARFRKRHTVRWVWIAYWAIMFLLTHAPRAPRTSPGIPHFDKLVHAAMFCVLAVLAGAALNLRQRADSFRVGARWAIVFALYGALDEWSQRFVHRDPDVLDWLADVAGIALGALLYWSLPVSRARLPGGGCNVGLTSSTSTRVTTDESLGYDRLKVD